MELSPGDQPVDKKPNLTADGLIQTTVAAQDQPTPVPASQTNSSSLTAILPVIYEIVRCVEKDPLDNTAKQRESQECSQKILELQKRFEIARAEVRRLSGINYNKEEQLQKLEVLRNQLELKQQLIRKYKGTQL